MAVPPVRKKIKNDVWNYSESIATKVCSQMGRDEMWSLKAM